MASISILLRKIRSAIILASANTRRLLIISFLKVWRPSVKFEKGVQIGRGIRFKTVSGGKILIGQRTSIEDHVLIQAERGIVQIGPDSFVGQGSQLVALQQVSIGSDALIAAGCIIRDADHCFQNPEVPIRNQGHIVRPIQIGNDVWLGAHVVVTAGSSIGDGAVIGANGVVKGDIPDYSVAVGVPARVVSHRGYKKSARG